MRTLQVRTTTPPDARRTTGARSRAARRRHPVVAVAAAAVLAVLTGCAELDGPRSAGSPGPTDDSTDDPGHPDLPLLQVQVRGGFLPMGWEFATVPEPTVYADGRAVTHGPQIAIYPPPALPHLVERDLGDPGVDALVAAAREAGLLDEVAPEYGRPNVADAGTTVVTLHVDGRTHAHAAEALSVVDGIDGIDGWDPGPGAEVTELPPQPPEAPSPENAAAWGLTEEHLRARAVLAMFLIRAREVVAAAPEAGPYVVERFAVMARPATPEPGTDDAAVEDGAAGSSPAADDELPRQVLAWPIEVALADAHDCLVVDGEDARVLREALTGVGFTARFEQAGVRYDAWFRPLLPHEDGCPA